MKIQIFLISFSTLFFTPKINAAENIEKLNTDACNILRQERRTEIYKAVKIDEVDAINKRFISQASDSELKKLKSAANVPENDPFFHSDEKLRNDLKSREDFADVLTLMAAKFASASSERYMRADGNNARTPFVRMTRNEENYRDTILAMKPTISTGRTIKRPKTLGLDYLNSMPEITFVVQEKFYDDPKDLKAHVRIMTDKKEWTFGEFIEETLPSNCKDPEIEYTDDFNSAIFMKSVNDSNKSNKKEAGPGESSNSAQKTDSSR